MLAIRARRAIVVAMLASAGALASNASASVLFQDNFEAGFLDWHWYGSSKIEADTPIFTHFNGRHTNADVRLTHPAVASPVGNGVGTPATLFNLYTVSFDLYLFDSWDGDSTVWGPDRINVDANGTNIFSETFANEGGKTQTYGVQPTLGRWNMGGSSGVEDSIYRNISLSFTVPENQWIVLSWNATGLEARSNESWAIDNVRLSYEVVPAPGVAGLAMAAGAVVCRRRRR